MGPGVLGKKAPPSEWVKNGGFVVVHMETRMDDLSLEQNTASSCPS